MQMELCIGISSHRTSLLDADGHVMLSDFGLAKQFEENARWKSLCGTVEYMSPEIILGKGHEKASDWWSVGILIFEMLTGNKDASKRLGGGPEGSEEIKRHKWLKSINWRKLEAREIETGFRPNVGGKECVANFDDRWTSMPLLDSPAASPRPGESNFIGFTYLRPNFFSVKLAPLCSHALFTSYLCPAILVLLFLSSLCRLSC